MKARVIGLSLILLACMYSASAEECMDCGERRTQQTDASGNPVWPMQAEALCCDYPCYGGYTIVEQNVGWGCNTQQVNNEILVGSICKSSTADKNCPGGGGTDGTTGNYNPDGGGDGCTRINGVCPANCASCP